MLILGMRGSSGCREATRFGCVICDDHVRDYRILMWSLANPKSSEQTLRLMRYYRAVLPEILHKLRGAPPDFGLKMKRWPSHV